MRLTQIRQILEIEKSGSITTAAKNLYITQPSLSATLNEFEEEIGIKLFVRSKHGVEITPEGALILPIMEQIMQQVNYIKTFNSEKNEEMITGSVHFNMGPSYDFLYGEFMQNAKKRFPKADIRISHNITENMLLELNRNIMDFAIGALEIKDKPISHNLSTDEAAFLLQERFPELDYTTLRPANTIAIFHRRYYPELSEPLLLEYLTKEQLILGEPYSAAQFDLYLKPSKYPITDLSWPTILDLLNRIPAIYLNATPLSIDQYRKLHAIQDPDLLILPISTQIKEIELEWPVFLFYKKNLMRQLHKGIYEEITVLLEKHNLVYGE